MTSVVPIFADKSDMGLHVGLFGDIGGDNASPAIQAMVNAVGYFTLPEGTFVCKDPITIKPAGETLQSIDTVFCGRGPNKSILQATNMAGASLFKPSNPVGLYRMAMRDMALIGDADCAFDFTLTGGQLYKSLFENVHFRSLSGPAFKAINQFATTHLRCSFHSDESHSIHMGGGNSTLLINCYAHKCGNGFAGFRIEGHATLIECVGLDDSTNPCYWGWFGKDGTGIYQIEIIGGNSEDFRTAAIALEYDGRIALRNFSMVAPASGQFETYIKILSGTAHRVLLEYPAALSKGAVMTAPANISGTGCQALTLNPSSDSAGTFANFYNTAQSLMYNVPNLQVRNTAYGRLSLQVSSLHSLRESGFIKPDVKTITVNATTFSVAGLNSVKTANTLLTFLAQLTGGEEGQELALLIGDANTTIKHNTGGAGRFILNSGADESPANGAVYKLISFGSVWRQV